MGKREKGVCVGGGGWFAAFLLRTPRKFIFPPTHSLPIFFSNKEETRRGMCVHKKVFRIVQPRSQHKDMRGGGGGEGGGRGGIRLRRCKLWWSGRGDGGGGAGKERGVNSIKWSFMGCASLLFKVLLFMYLFRMCVPSLPTRNDDETKETLTILIGSVSLSRRRERGEGHNKPHGWGGRGRFPERGVKDETNTNSAVG